MTPWWRTDAVTLTPHTTSADIAWLDSLHTEARTAAHPADLRLRLDLAEHLGVELPLPGEDPARLWSALATLAAADLGVARTVEAHTDAVAILAQARADGATDIEPQGGWGVYAAEGPGGRLEARESDDGWRLTGPKPWCSLAAHLDHALVTAHVDDDRRLFAVDLHHPGVTPQEQPWAGRGLVEVPSAGLTFADVPAEPVGEPGWYLTRPGFAWGGIGVAAIWLGGAVGIARTLSTGTTRREPDQVALMHLGAVDQLLQSAFALLGTAASAVADGSAESAPGGPRRLALLCRTHVARVAEEVLARVCHATGPAPLTGDEAHAKAVADLTVYLRQDHAERDLAALGQLLAGDLRAAR